MSSKQVKKSTSKKEKRKVVVISNGPKKLIEDVDEEEAVIQSMQTRIKNMKKQQQKKKTDSSAQKGVKQRKSDGKHEMVRKISMPRLRMKSNFIEMIDPNQAQQQTVPLTSYRPVIQHQRIVVNPKSSSNLILPYRFHI